MKDNSRLERQKQIQFAVGIVALDGGNPSAFTRNLLKPYELGQITSTQLKQAIVQKYTKDTN
ncbi:antitoxin VbhA family protein [Solibacillus sp. FSL K6-1126]|uniref:antitoxin VbhA family protein n=1 Tax=Solibacillus sp. FSL K6-1126 TaxID=2921463 RepID=UPI0030F5E8FD